MSKAETVDLDDGGVLGYQEYGHPGGRPVFLLHGTPGSRKGPRPRTFVLHLNRVRLIAYDRPGYGCSARRSGRSVADAARDVRLLADRLGIGSFAVVGRSGGAPHALACAALLPDRVVRAAALVAVAPRDLMGEQWFHGMNERNAEWYRMAERGIKAYTAHVIESMNRSRTDPDAFLPYEDPELPKADRAVISDHGIRTMLTENFEEGLRPNVGGWIDDNLALINPWGFDPAAIAVDVQLWHGTADRYSPVGHSQWLADAIPKADLLLGHGRSHFGAVEELPRVLRWAAAGFD